MSPAEPQVARGIDPGAQADAVRADDDPVVADPSLETSIDLPLLGATIRHVFFVILTITMLIVLASAVFILLLF
jgi:hypothetical protein